MNNISFTGINNLNIKCDVFNMMRTNKYATKFQLTCNLSDDFNGKDFTFFKEQLEKSNSLMPNECIKVSTSSDITLRAFATELDEPVINDFFLNYLHVESIDNKRARLPLYTFIAKFVNKIKETMVLSDVEVKGLELLNKAANNQAVRIFEDK